MRCVCVRVCVRVCVCAHTCVHMHLLVFVLVCGYHVQCHYKGYHDKISALL